MRSGGYKCYNFECGACIGKTLCGEPSDAALWCDSRMVRRKTNADHIRSMTDEELAQFLTYFDRCECCTFEHRCTDKCIGGVKKWLKQPYEEENHGKA